MPVKLSFGSSSCKVYVEEHYHILGEDSMLLDAGDGVITHGQSGTNPTNRPLVP